MLKNLNITMNTITLKGLTQKITALTLKSLEENKKKKSEEREKK